MNMTQADELGATYDDAFDSIKRSLANLQRQTSAALMAEFPDREYLSVQAERLRLELESEAVEAVEVNVLVDDKQITIVSQPTGVTVNVEIVDKNSLCVLTVGADMPLAVDNLATSPITSSHSARNAWGAWASAPVHIQGYPAGTICALESAPRLWTDQDEAELKAVARTISNTIEEWAK